MKAYQVAERVRVHFGNYDYALDNTYVFRWESDFFAISKSGYSVEVEIKVSKADFKNDFKKNVICFNNEDYSINEIKKHDYLADKNTTHKPNKFYFAIPENLVDYNDIPKEYGIIIIRKSHSWDYFELYLIRHAKFLHRNKILEDLAYSNKLLKKFYFRNIDLIRAMELWRHDIKYGQHRIDKTRY